ncbi:MAG: hypothetical protein JEY99_20825 [Spirochaetales bacterium]|nr:hypothetical protein [Spirochaetales bacterium]
MKKGVFFIALIMFTFFSLSATDIWQEGVYAEVAFPFSIGEKSIHFDGFEINGFFGNIGFGVTLLPFKAQKVLAINMLYMFEFPVDTITGWFTPMVALRMGILGGGIGIAPGAGAKFYWDYYERNYITGSAIFYYDLSFDGGGFNFELAPALGGDTVGDILTFGGGTGNYTYTYSY